MESRLKDDLGLDSMSTLSFLMSLEDNLPGFAVDPDTLDANHLETVASVMEYVSSEMNMAA
jgi:acyl carrier protein